MVVLKWFQFPVGEVEDLDELVDTLGCGKGTLPAKYMGLLFKVTYCLRAIWDPVIEKLTKNLAFKRANISL